MAELMPLPLTVSCSSKIQIGFTLVVLAHLGSHGQRCVCVCVRVCVCILTNAVGKRTATTRRRAAEVMLTLCSVVYCSVP